MTADLRARALAYLRTGSVLLRHIRSEHQVATCPPHEVVAVVRGHSGDHVVDLVDGMWTCTARRCITAPTCAHRAAVQLVTVPAASAAYRETGRVAS